MRPARLVLVCGLPGAGKTTLARKLAVEIRAVRLCADEWMAALGVDLFDEEFRRRLEQLFWQLAQEMLGSGRSVILESGFWQRSDRDEKRIGARQLGAAVDLHYLDVGIDERWRRIQERNAEPAWQDVPITREQLEHWATLFEAPDGDELGLFDEGVVTTAGMGR